MPAIRNNRPKGCARRLLLVAALLGPWLPARADSPRPLFPAVVVATRDSSDKARAAADFVGDGTGDQDEINAAIRSLPAAGGTVLLCAGTYDIRRVDGTLGGVLIERSHVVLAGEGAATRLVLAPDQNTNVIRILGSGVGHVTIRDLAVDGNREQNSAGTGDPKISHDRFEFCGIKGFRQAPRGPSQLVDCHHIVVRNCLVENAHRLGIMLEGPSMRVVDNQLGNAGSDVVEILTGPGEIRGNIVEITGQTHVAIGSDRANSILMSDNIVQVRRGGRLDIGFRSWAGSKRHVLSGNVLTVDEGGACAMAMDVRGSEATITGNNLQGDAGRPARLRISAGNVVASANVFEHVVIEVDDQTGGAGPIRVFGNIEQETTLELRSGRLLREASESSPAR